MSAPQFEQPARPTADADRSQTVPVEPPAAAASDEQQAEYLAEYQLQLRRMSCPGCGDGEPNF